MERRLLPSEEIASWRPATVSSVPYGVLGELGDQGQCDVERDGTGPSESRCETNGGFYQQCGMQAGVVDAHAHGAQQEARVPWVAKVLGSGAVGSWDELYQSEGPGAPLAAGWHDGSRRAGVWHGTGGAIPTQGIR